MKFRTSRQFLARLANRRATRALQAALLLTLGSASAGSAATYYWDSGLMATGSGSGGTGTWSTSVSNWYLPGSGDVNWPATTNDLASFGGVAGTVTLGSAISDGGMTFTTAGYTIAASSFTLTLSALGIDTSALTSGTTTINQAITLGGNSTITTGSGHTLALGGLITTSGNTLTFTNTGASATATGTGQVNLTGGLNAAYNGAKINFNGIVNWSAGTGTFGSATTASSYIGVANGTAGTFNLSGGAITSYSGANMSFFVGSAGATGVLNISGGSFTVGTTTGENVYFGNGNANSSTTGGSTAGTSGTLNLSGNGSFSTGTTTGNFFLGNVSAGGVGEINLNGGTLSTLRSIKIGSATGSATTGNTATFNFNGGTLQATGTALNLTGLTAANVRNGGAVIDTNTFSPTITQALTHSAIGGDNATDGGLTKNGAGTLTLSGVNTYTGGTTINAGTLAFGNATGTTQTLGGAVTGTGGLTQSGLGKTVLANTANGSTYSGATTISNGVLAGIGSHAFGNTTGISIAGGPTSPTLSLRGDGSTTFATAANNTPYTVIPTASGAAINVTSATAGGTTAKTMTIGPIVSSSTETAFVLNLTGSNNTSLSTGAVSRGATAVAATTTFANAIAGGGSLTIASYAGSNTAGGETVIFDGAGNTIVTGSITPSSATALAVTKNGTGTLTLNGASTYTGNTTVSAGTLLLGASDRINDAATVTLNGGTLNTGGFQEGRATSASATAGLGALTLSTSSTLDFGAGHAGSSVLAFAASNAQTWNGTLTLTDFTPLTDFLNFTSNTGLTSAQLGEISLSGFTATGLDSFGNVLFTAVPEPATWAAGALLFAVAGWQFCRRTVRRAA